MGRPCGGQGWPPGLAGDGASGWSSFGAGCPLAVGRGKGPCSRGRPEASGDNCAPELPAVGSQHLGSVCDCSPCSPLPACSYSLSVWTTGISGKSQVLFAVVFTARYLDLFTNYISLYNTCMKVKDPLPPLEQGRVQGRCRRCGPGPLGLREEGWGWTPGSEGGGQGSGPLGLREESWAWTPGSEGEGWAWTPGSEGGGWCLDPWV
jgi:hypothetical protein